MNIGPKIHKDNLVLCYDASSTRSTLRTHQLNNTLPDPGAWAPGTGGSTGYGSNGSGSEQLRVHVPVTRVLLRDPAGLTVVAKPGVPEGGPPPGEPAAAEPQAPTPRVAASAQDFLPIK